jgi:hypothetical protein
MSPTVERLATAMTFLILTAPLAVDAYQTGRVYRLGIFASARFAASPSFRQLP